MEELFKREMSVVDEVVGDVHGVERPFCYNPLCGCHDHTRRKHRRLVVTFEQGLLTEREATRVFLGQHI